jgi:hypothetical protein
MIEGQAEDELPERVRPHLQISVNAFCLVMIMVMNLIAAQCRCELLRNFWAWN